MNMRKPSFTESAIVGYALYMAFTLSVHPEWIYQTIESNPETMYAMYLEFLGTQRNLIIFSLVVAVMAIGSLFTEHFVTRVAVNVLGIIYFTLLAASYVYSYPNLGLGLSAIFIILMIVDTNNIINEYHEKRKKEIMEDSIKGGEDRGEIREQGEGAKEG